MKFRRSLLLDIWVYNTPQSTATTYVAITSLFEIYFLRQERTYTKLKYSRVPQYDMVSGGSAALLAGFLGFLVCEKFGFELLDSGDFYILFMYGVLTGFIGRLFLLLQTTAPTTFTFYHPVWYYNYAVQLGRCLYMLQQVYWLYYYRRY